MSHSQKSPHAAGIGHFGGLSLKKPVKACSSKAPTLSGRVASHSFCHAGRRAPTSTRRKASGTSGRPRLRLISLAMASLVSVDADAAARVDVIPGALQDVRRQDGCLVVVLAQLTGHEVFNHGSFAVGGAGEVRVSGCEVCGDGHGVFLGLDASGSLSGLPRRAGQLLGADTVGIGSNDRVQLFANRAVGGRHIGLVGCIFGGLQRLQSFVASLRVQSQGSQAGLFGDVCSVGGVQSLLQFVGLGVHGDLLICEPHRAAHDLNVPQQICQYKDYLRHIKTVTPWGAA